MLQQDTTAAREDGIDVHLAGPAKHVYVARQPILDRYRRVFGYELLFRPAGPPDTDVVPTDATCAHVISDAVLAFGLETLTGGRLAFITISRNVLLGEMPAVLRPDLTVLELGADIEPTEETRSACTDLRRMGYHFALDQFECTDRMAALMPFADYLKYDAHGAKDFAAMRRFISRYRTNPTTMVAEHVEEAEDFVAAQHDGFKYFQGYFFGRPATHEVSDIPGRRFDYLQLLRALQDPDISIARIEDLIKSDASLCYRILRTVNSAAFGQRVEVSSIRHALVLMGCGTVRRWVSLWLLAGVSEQAPEELITMSTVRAKCCELLCHRLGWDDAADGFLLGLCSMLDAILECPMETVLAHLPLSGDLVAALGGDDTPGRRLLDCVVAYERGEWERCQTLAHRAGIDLSMLASAYGQALLWADACRLAQ